MYSGTAVCRPYALPAVRCGCYNYAWIGVVASLLRQVSCLWQAVSAVQALNGSDLGGRAILVREDREDKDVKNYNRCTATTYVNASPEHAR